MATERDLPLCGNGVIDFGGQLFCEAVLSFRLGLG